MKLLITGANGFIGSHFKDYLKNNNPDQFEIFELKSDLTDPVTLFDELSQLPKIEACLHLAGISNVYVANSDPVKAYLVNTIGTQILLDTFIKCEQKPQFIFASTGQVYSEGSFSLGLVNETSEINPQNIYAKSKYLAELSCELYSKLTECQVTVLRIFNHVHADQTGNFFFPSVRKQILESKKSEQSSVELQLGNLDLLRDIGALDDLLEAISLVLLKSPKSAYQVYNICSGTTKNLREIVEKIAVYERVTVKINVDQSKVRVGEPKVIQSSNELFRSHYNWNPTHSKDLDTLMKYYLTGGKNV